MKFNSQSFNLIIFKATVVVFCIVVGVTAFGCKKSTSKYYDDLNKLLKKYKIVEGHTNLFPERHKCLVDLVKSNKIKNIAEIGFNAGHSSITFLLNNKKAKLWSFDLCTHKYYYESKKYIKSIFKDRFNITCGNSLKTVPQFYKDNPDFKFDLIHIDGGHLGEIPKKDIMNMVKLSHKDTLILVDDCNVVKTSKKEGWTGAEVNKAWRYFSKKKIIKPILHNKCNIGNCLGKPTIK
ncbi:class I SAM-dependent methyltransferase [Spirochaetota bacterium]